MDYTFTPKQVRCSCSLTHSHYTRYVAAGEGLVGKINEAVSDVLKAGHVALCYSQEDESVASEAGDILVAAGYKVTRIYYADGTEPTPDAADDIVNLPDSVRAIIFVGDSQLCDIAKYAAVKKQCEWIYIPTTPDAANAFSPTATFGMGIGIDRIKCKPAISAVIDDDIMRRCSGRRAAEGYGNIIGYRLKCYEYSYAVRIKGADYCLAGIRRLGAITENFLNCDNASAAAIARASVKIGLNNQMYRLDMMCDCDAIARVIAACADDGRSLGENMPIAAYVLAGLYRQRLGLSRFNLALPADRVGAVNELCKLCGNDKIAAISSLKPIYDYAKEWYLLSEYGGDIQEELDKYTSHLSRSSKVFRRLYDDAGYWLNKYGSADKFVAIGKAVLDAKLVYSDRGVEDTAVI